MSPGADSMTISDDARTPSRTSERILELDALRGLAAIAVMFYHFTTRYDELFGHVTALPAGVPWGSYGVDLFFMLSGFVILMSLDRQNDPLAFAWGRLSRLYPTYWVAVVMTFIIATWYGLAGQTVSLGEAVVNLTMVQALLGVPHVDGAYWSLQAELIFYANMLLFYRVGGFARPLRGVIPWVTIANLVQFALHNAWVAEPRIVDALEKFSTLTSLKFIPLFGLGILSYSMYRKRVLPWPAIAVGIYCVLSIGGYENWQGCLGVAALVATLNLAVFGFLSWLRGRWLVYAGAISYPLYLIHQNIGYVAIQEFERQGSTPTVAIAIAVVAAFVLAVLLHHGIESPALKLLRKWHPQKKHCQKNATSTGITLSAGAKT